MKVSDAIKVRLLVLEALGDNSDALRKRRADEFRAAGGCERCNGRGWVVTWDTMDSMSGCYAEYGACPDAGKLPEVHGENAPFNHAIYSKYDKNRGVKMTLALTEDEIAEDRSLRLAFDEAERQLDRAERQLDRAELAAVPSPGRSVKILKGTKVGSRTKVKPGTEGRVFYRKPGRYDSSFRVGVELADGGRVFADEKNVEVI